VPDPTGGREHADLEDRQINTRIRYHYCDGGNWKKEGSWILSGKAAPQDVRSLCDALDDQGFFVPHAVGMPMLAPYGEKWCEDDHTYHSILSIADTFEPADAQTTLAELAAEFAKQGDWTKAASEAGEALDDSSATENEDEEMTA
jgi:hypothetical protein